MIASAPQFARRVRAQRATLIAIVVAPAASLSLPKGSLAFSQLAFILLFFGWVLTFVVVWLCYLYQPCPSCNEPFFVRGDPSSKTWLYQMRGGIKPFGSSCANCALPLAGSRHGA